MIPISFYRLLRDLGTLIRWACLLMLTYGQLNPNFDAWIPLLMSVKYTGDHDWFLVIDFPWFLLAVREICLWELVLVHTLVFCCDTVTSNTECDIMISDPISYRSMTISYSCENDGKNERCNLPFNIFMLLVHSLKGSFKCDRKDSWDTWDRVG